MAGEKIPGTGNVDDRIVLALGEALDMAAAKGAEVMSVTMKCADGTAWQSEVRCGSAPEATPEQIAKAVERRKELAARLKRTGAQ